MKQQVEDVYKKVTQLEHVLLRPDSYVGSIEASQAELWVWDGERFGFREVEVHQGLYKIFDEILVNAADNYQRDKSMRSLTVEVGPTRIVVENDGKGIPIQIHKEQKLYVPELIFGHLLTSSNYDDSIKKVTGGRNGFGAKLTNIFSKQFTLETADKNKVFRMTWSDNMTKHTQPDISENKGGQFTRVTFTPDFARFGVTQLSEDMLQLLHRRVADMAAILPNVKVTLNGKRVQVGGFKEYVRMHGVEKFVMTTTEQNGRRWEVAVSHSDGQFNQVSFVNAINTSRGGTHVHHVADQLVTELIAHIKKKHKDFKAIKPFQVKQHLFVFVNCLIENPAFDSQTKETLTTKVAAFGSKFELTQKFVDDIVKSTDVVANVVLSAKQKMDNKMAKQLTGKKTSRLLGIEKLEDANDAGTRNAEHCTLILTEGDSAKSLAMAGIEVVGRDRWGVFPLRGKMLNVRDASAKQITENKEIESLVKILGLRFNQQYESTKSLRYGAVMIMTDQDHDGHHIKGLIINLFDKFWPSLLKARGFLKQFVTPIIKATHGNQTVSFFSIGEYRQWSQTYPEQHLFKIKYYKGLGTSSDQEGQQYFGALAKHVKPFRYVDSTDQDYIDLAFSKSKADARKDWLLQYSWDSIGDTLDYSQANVRYKSFITDCLALYSVSDNIRSIPSMLDGLKPTQRKILYTLLTHSKSIEHKVSSLSGLVSTYANYHHGEQSLHTTIISMAQTFTGSNNINLLLPSGQFGSRAMGGKDAASARYIFTKLNPLAAKLFHEDDLHTYAYTEDEGQSGEPTFFVPIIPLVLVNGADGIGTGWMTSVPCYNPRELAEQLKAKLRGKPFEELTPWYKNFTGTISFNQNSFLQRGHYIRSGDTLYVLEIPVNRTTKDFQGWIQAKMQADPPDVIDMKEYHAGNKVCFEIQFKEGFIGGMSDDVLDKYLRLTAPINLNNMVLFDTKGVLKRYPGMAEIMDDFYVVRLRQYELRKQYLVSKTRNELDLVENKIAFIEGMLRNELKLHNLKRKEMVEQLRKHRLKGIGNMTVVTSTKPKGRRVVDEPSEVEPDDFKNFDYLLGMPFWSFSEEHITKLKQEQKSLTTRLHRLEAQSPSEMWEQDLDEFIGELDKLESQEEAEYLKRLEKNAEKLVRGGSKMLRGKAMQDEDDEDYSDDAPKKKSKVMHQVLREFGNLGVSSKRPRPPPVVFVAKKSKKRNEGDIEIEFDQQEESANKPSGVQADFSKGNAAKTQQLIQEEPKDTKQKKLSDLGITRTGKKKVVLEIEDSEVVVTSKNGRSARKRKGKDSDDESDEIPKRKRGEDSDESVVEFEVPATNGVKKATRKQGAKQIQESTKSKRNQKGDAKLQRVVTSRNKIDSDEELPAKKRSATAENPTVKRRNLNLIESDEEQPAKKQVAAPLPQVMNEQQQQEKDLYAKYGLSSFLKYLDGKPSQNTDPSQMTLAERLLLRQQEGRSTAMNEAYKDTLQQLHTSSKKQSAAKSKVKTDEDELDLLEFDFE